MKKLKINLKYLKYISFILFFILFFSKNLSSNELSIIIQGNKYTDSDVILSLLSEIPTDTNKDYSNEIIKTLNDSDLFSNVEIEFNENKYIIIVKEYPIIDKIKFKNNDRLKKEELLSIVDDLEFTKFNNTSINLFIRETKEIYESFGYNNVKIEYYEKFNQEQNTVDITFNINEGEITKINQIIITGNDAVSAQELRDIIVSKTKSLTNIFANNNFKPLTVERDKFKILNYYQDNGYLNAVADFKIEYLQNNKVNLYFNINEGDIFYLSDIFITDDKGILNQVISDNIESKKINFLSNQDYFSLEKIREFKDNISTTIIESGVEFFEINISDKIENNYVKIFFEIHPLTPQYTKQINIVGNNRTFDYVIRRELNIIEGDSYNRIQIDNLRKKLQSLNLFEKVNIKEEKVDENLNNLIIEVEEKQTGSFNAGLSVGTIDGFAIVTGLRERNFYGTGRSLDALINTSEDNNELKIITTDRLSYENEADISYKINYKQKDFSTSSSYKVDSFSSGFGIGYKINSNFYHNFDLEYVLKDYKITNSNTVAQSILDSSGSNASFLVKNNFIYSSLNPGFVKNNGNYFNFNNTIETPTSSSNGYIRNLITLKKYYNFSKTKIFSIQTKFGNIFSLNNNDILTDNKFALGGRWLRGFDSYGVGPRNSRTSYIGGNNIIASKLDYSFEISNNSNFPIFLNLFNDYGLIWENKTTPTNSDNSLRSSAGFGIKYYSPIGPIGLTWGFPIMEEDYDIKRMFLFSIGNID